MKLTKLGALVAALFIAVTAGLTGCWGKKEEPVAPPAAPKPAEISKPGAIDILKLAPEEAAIAVTAPCPQKLYDRTVKLAKRFSGDAAAIDAQIKEAVDAAAAKFKVTAATSFTDIAHAKGIDPEAPIGLFVDLTQTVDAFQKKAAEPAPIRGPQEEPGAPPADDKAAEKDSPTTPQEPGAAETPPVNPAKQMQEMTPPAVAVVVTCEDVKLAEPFIREIAAEVRGAGAAAPQESDAEGTHFVTYDPNKFSFFVTGRSIVMGNSMEFLKSVAKRFTSPAEVRYGSQSFPANDDDQLVSLIRMDRLKSIVDALAPLAQGLPGGMMTSAMLQNQDALNALAGKDPLVVTVNMNDEKVEVLSRLDTATHPDLAKLAGPAQPLRLAAYLPENTLALLCMRFNSETKATLGKTLVNSMGSGAKDDQTMAGAMGASSMVLDMIDDEVVVGITGVANGFPKLAALAALANPQQTQGFLQQSGVKVEGEEYSGVQIMQVPVVFATVFYAFVDKTLAASNDIDQLKSSIDSLKSGSKSALFKSLKPALDESVPRYGAFLVRSRVVDEVVKPIMQQTPSGSSPDLTGMLDRVSHEVRELRITQDLNGAVDERHVTVFLN